MIILIGVNGCSMKNDVQSNRNKVELNARQKAILETEGLATDYEKLSSSQQKSIIAIEELLNLVEKKYNKKFCYAGYISGGDMECETLIAYPEGGDKELDQFKVERNEDGTFKDTYMNMYLRESYEEILKSFTKSVFSVNEIKIYSEVINTSLMKMPEEKDEYRGNIEGTSLIFLSDSEITDTDYVQGVQELEAVIKEEKLFGSYQIILIKSEFMQELTEFNYSDYLEPDDYKERRTFYVNK